MTRSRWWTLIAVVALVPLAVRLRADAPKWPQGTCPDLRPHRINHKLIQKSYPVAGLVATLSEGPAGSRGTDLLIRAITCAVKPESWSKRGGHGTIDYCPEGKTLIVNQTAGVHERVEAVLKALAAMQPKQPAKISPITPAAYSSPSAHLKQYGHFVLDNVRVNAMGVSCTIKRVRFMYKGDGIDADVAKCALTNGESEKKADVPRVLTELLEKVQEGDKTTGVLSGGAGGAVLGNVISKATGGSRCFYESSLPASALGTAPAFDPGQSDPILASKKKGEKKAEVKDADAKTEKGKAKPE